MTQLLRTHKNMNTKRNETTRIVDRSNKIHSQVVVRRFCWCRWVSTLTTSTFPSSANTFSINTNDALNRIISPRGIDWNDVGDVGLIKKKATVSCLQLFLVVSGVFTGAVSVYRGPAAATVVVAFTRTTDARSLFVAKNNYI